MQRVRVSIDGNLNGNPIHCITNLNGLLDLVCYAMQKRMYRVFLSCKEVKYTKKLRRGLKIEIFEY